MPSGPATRAAAVLARLLFIGVALYVFWRTTLESRGFLESLSVWGLLKVGLWVLPAAALTWALERGERASAWRLLGLWPPAWRGFGLGILATAPFALVWWLAPRGAPDLDTLVGDVLLGPFAEEVLFRGFLFLALRRLGWRFWSAALLSAAMFGAAHVPNLTALIQNTALSAWYGVGLDRLGPSWASAIAVTAQTGAGGLLFAWMCEQWRVLWPGIGLHAAMNFWWVMVYGSEAIARPAASAATPWAAASVVSFAVVVVLTLRYASGRQRVSPRELAIGDQPSED